MKEKCFVHVKRTPCGKPAEYRVVIGSKPGKKGGDDAFYCCEEHLEVIKARAVANGFPIRSITWLGKPKEG